MVKWTDQWLKTAGCSEISLNYQTDSEGRFTKFTIAQSPFNKVNTPENRLRLQKFEIALLDEEMHVIKTV